MKEKKKKDSGNLLFFAVAALVVGILVGFVVVTYFGSVIGQAAGVNRIASTTNFFDKAINCTDTDAGDVPAVNGRAYGLLNGVQYNNVERCISDTRLREFYCVGGRKLTKYYTCPCVEGACVEESEPTPAAIPSTGTNNPTPENQSVPVPGEETCADTDGGYNIYIQGTVTNGTGSYTDYCTFFNQMVREYYCSSGEMQYNDTKCTAGNCTAGRCIKTGTG